MEILAQSSNVLDPIKASNPYVYIIIIGLVFALSSLALVIKMLWDKNNVILKEKDSLHESKLQLALSSTETIREAISLVQSIHENVIKMTDSHQERKIAEERITNSLENIKSDIDKIYEEIRRK